MPPQLWRDQPTTVQTYFHHLSGSALFSSRSFPSLLRNGRVSTLGISQSERHVGTFEQTARVLHACRRASKRASVRTIRAEANDQGRFDLVALTASIRQKRIDFGLRRQLYDVPDEPNVLEASVEQDFSLN